MRRSVSICGVLALTLPLLWTAPADARRERHDESAERTIRETIVRGSKRRVVVDNLNGSIRVRATATPEIRLVAVERIVGRTSAEIEQARREVELGLHDEGETLVICADGPFRDPDDCTEWHDGKRHDPPYEVIYEIELEVPRELDLRLRTVHGDIDVSGARGAFHVGGVNGEIRLDDIAGSGSARTVNGPVTVTFSENPTADCTFQTVNGELDVTFTAGLSAEMTFKTLNGRILSDFDYEQLPPRSAQQDSRSGTRFRLDSSSAIRIGGGGPHFDFENINGDIRIRRQN